MPESRTLTHKKILEHHNGLVGFGSRAMHTAVADSRVGRLISAFDPIATAIQKGRERVAADKLRDAGVEIADVAKMSPTQQQLIQALIAVAQSEYDDEEVEIEPWPSIRIKEEDLPRPKGGEDGWKNANALGVLTAMIGDLFVPATVEGEDAVQPIRFKDRARDTSPV